MISVESRTCSVCGETKPLSKFRPDRRRKTGRRSYCLECNRGKTLATATRNQEKFQASGVTSKECSCCGKMLPLSRFNKNQFSHTGYTAKCIPCRDAQQAARVVEERDAITRLCIRCNTEKPVAEFDASKRVVHRWCKGCKSSYKANFHQMKREMVARFRAGEDPDALTREYSSRSGRQGGAALKNVFYRFAHRCVDMARSRARSQGVAFDLTAEWMMDKLSRECEATGLPFDLTTKKGPFTPSLDRVVPGSDYTQSNTRVVCFIYNMSKNKWSDDDVRTMACAIADRVRQEQ